MVEENESLDGEMKQISGNFLPFVSQPAVYFIFGKT
jgi:hypothetical protein